MHLERFYLTTERLSLEPLSDGHRNDVHRAIFAEPDVVRTLMGDASDENKQLQLLDEWYEEYATTWSSNGYGLWGIFRREQQSELPEGLLGIIWLEKTDDRPSGKTDIGYALTPSAWGKGIAFEAAEKVIDYAFRYVGVRAVDALIFGNINPGSVKLIEKLGGRFLGKKPFEEYGGQEWFDMCHSFDLWMIKTADASMIHERVRGACYRTGQFVAEAYLTKQKAMEEISDSIAENSALQVSNTITDNALSALEQGCADAGWSHYRIANPAL